MSDVNVITMTGRLTRPAEFKAGNNGGAVVSFSIANNRREYNPKTRQYEDAADFFNCRLLFSDAEKAQKRAEFLTQGKYVSVTGAIRNSEYQDKEGNKRQYVYILADKVDFLGGGQKKDDAGNGGQQNQGGGKQNQGSYRNKGSYQQNGGKNYRNGGNGGNGGYSNQHDDEEWGNDPMPDNF